MECGGGDLFAALLHLACERLDVGVYVCCGVCGGIEITIDAALLAKGDVDVEHVRGAVKLQLMCE